MPKPHRGAIHIPISKIKLITINDEFSSIRFNPVLLIGTLSNILKGFFYQEEN
jgi:hypothetical protein